MKKRVRHLKLFYSHCIEEKIILFLSRKSFFSHRHSEAFQSHLNLSIRPQTVCRERGERKGKETSEKSFSYPGKWKHKRLICFWYFISLNFEMLLLNFLPAFSTVLKSFLLKLLLLEKNIMKETWIHAFCFPKIFGRFSVPQKSLVYFIWFLFCLQTMTLNV